MIEKSFDRVFIANLALHEKQIQQNYRPIIAVHKWFARRPGTLFRGLLLSEFVDGDLKEIFYKSHNLKNIKVADPFMGGGTPLVEANRVGCDVVGYDINPMAYWIVRQEIEQLDLINYKNATDQILQSLNNEIGSFYKTKCMNCSNDAQVKYFLWVKIHKCDECGKVFDLYPSYLIAKNERHPKNVIICSNCGELNEIENKIKPGNCQKCRAGLKITGPASRNRCLCPKCGKINTYPNTREEGPPQHRMIAIEYHCDFCKPNHRGRFFKKPDPDDLDKYEQASKIWLTLESMYVPDDEIPPGDESNRLRRWGYRRYREMFNHRQLLSLELCSRAITDYPDEIIRNAMATNLSDLLRYQNMLCRYDTMALKSLDIFSVHGFPVGLIQCESNSLGIRDERKGLNIGSGGWVNIVDKYRRAKNYCEKPFEIRHINKQKKIIPVDEWIGDKRQSSGILEKRNVELYCKSSTCSDIQPNSLDAIFTDPPYFANVQYAELMDFCYVWLRKLVVDKSGVFDKKTTRDINELTGNITMDKGLYHFTEGLSKVFINMTRALKPGAPFAFTYHHNKIEAYLPIAVAILDAGLTCSATIACPAEMGSSIHINGTGSSIIDTVFVCRTTGTVPRRTIASTAEEIAKLVEDDLGFLRQANVNPTVGDTRCITYGHLVRLAIWNLRKDWVNLSTSQKLSKVMAAIEKLGGWSGVENCLAKELRYIPKLQIYQIEEEVVYGGEVDEISF